MTGYENSDDELLDLWWIERMDTRDIALKLSVPECEVYNRLSRLHDKSRVDILKDIGEA